MNALVDDIVGKPNSEVETQKELGSIRHLGVLTKLFSKDENEDKGLSLC